MSNPPFAQRVPVIGRDSARNFYGENQQYGFLYRSGSITVVNDPPFARRVPIESKDPARQYYGENQHYGFSYQSGAYSVPPVVNPPPVIDPNSTGAYGTSGTYGWRAIWVDATWSAQRANSASQLVQPYPGDEPPGYMVPPDLADYPYPAWDTQSTVRGYAPLINPPVVSVPEPVSFANQLAIRGAWPQDAWAAQSSYAPVVTLTFAYGSQPAPTSRTAASAIRAMWADATWTAQTQSPAAWFASLAIVSQPAPNSTALQQSIRAQWPNDSWNAQRALTQAPLTLVYGAQPPLYTLASFYSLRAVWPDAGWNTQRTTIAQIPQPSNPPIKASSAAFAAVRSLWTDALWNAQSAAAVAAPGPLAAYVPNLSSSVVRAAWVDVAWDTARAPKIATLPGISVQNPPLVTGAVQSAIRALWADGPNPAQRSALLAATTPSIIQVPPTVGQGAVQTALRAVWLPDSWVGVTAAPVAALIPPVIDSPPLSTLQFYIVRAAWLGDSWNAQAAFNPLASVFPVSSPVGLYVFDPEFDDRDRRDFRTYRFPILGPTEERVFTFDFTSDLSDTETLAGMIGVQLTCSAGLDPNPIAIIQGVPAFDPLYTQAMMPIMGTIPDNDYYLIVTAPTTNAKKILARYGLIRIRS